MRDVVDESMAETAAAPNVATIITVTQLFTLFLIKFISFPFFFSHLQSMLRTNGHTRARRCFLRMEPEPVPKRKRLGNAPSEPTEFQTAKRQLWAALCEG